MIFPIMPVDISALSWFICLEEEEKLKNISNISPDEGDRYSHGGEYSAKMEPYSKVLTKTL